MQIYAKVWKNIDPQLKCVSYLFGGPNVRYFKKLKSYYFFGSEKLKKCTNNIYHHDFPNYANFEG